MRCSLDVESKYLSPVMRNHALPGSWCIGLRPFAPRSNLRSSLGWVRPAVCRSVVLLAAVMSAAQAAAQRPGDRVIQGSVVDSLGLPIAYVNLVGARGNNVVADEAGFFKLVARAAERLSLEVRRIGLRSLKLDLAPVATRQWSSCCPPWHSCSKARSWRPRGAFAPWS
jgi:hypothetical protein